MAIRSDAQKKAVAKYNAKNYEQILLRVKVGMTEEIKAHAATHNESVNGYIKRAITETMERDQVEKRFAEIDALPAEKPTPEEIAAFDKAAADDPAETVTLEEYKIQSKTDTHKTARMMIEASIERGESVSSIPDWYIEEVASDKAKRERLLAYALNHADEDSSFRKIIKLFKGMV